MDTFNLTGPIPGVTSTPVATADKPKDSKALPDAIPEQYRDAVRQAADWFRDDKDARAATVELQWAEVEKMRRNDHWSLFGANGEPLRSAEEQRQRPNSVENVTFSLIEGQVAEFSQDMELVDVAMEAGDDEAASLMTDLKRAIANKNRMEIERLAWNRDFFWLGSACYEHNFDPDWTGGRGPNRWVGEVRWRALDIYAFYADARCRRDLHEGNRCHKSSPVTLEYLRDRYPEYGHLVHAEISDTVDDADEDNDTGTEAAEASTKDMVGLQETWYIGKPLLLGPDEKDDGKGLHVIWWAGEGQRIYLKHANYVTWKQGETPKFPFTFRWRYPQKGTIYGFGEAHYLKSMNIGLNKNSEISIEANMFSAFGRTYINTSAVTTEQAKEIEQLGALANMHFFVDDINGIRHVAGQAVPPGVQAECDRIKRAMEAQIGRYDVSQGQAPGSVTAFRALDLLAQRAKVRLISADVAMKTAYEDCGNYINELIVDNYTEARAYRIVGRQQGDEVKRGVFKLADIQRVHFPRTGTVIPLKGWRPKKGQIEGQDFEIYAPEMDAICRTTTSMPSDRMFFMEMAKELFSQHAIGPETLLYVIDKGKFPPIEQLIADLQKTNPPPQPTPAPTPAPAPAPSVGLAPAGPIKFNVSSADPGVVLATLQAVMQSGGAPTGGQGALGPEELAALRSRLPPEHQAQVAALSPEEQTALFEALANGGSADVAQAG